MIDCEQRLEEVLQEEIRVYQELLKIKQSEKEALLSLSTAEMERTNAAQETLADEGARLERERRQVVCGLAPADWHGDDEPTLKDVLEWPTVENRSGIAALGERLSGVCNEVVRAQDANAQLIGTSTGFLQDLLGSLLKRAQPDSGAYGKDGAKARIRETLPSLLDQTL
jgi:flagellar biosynthesis/type III secretory pathway chaperone